LSVNIFFLSLGCHIFLLREETEGDALQRQKAVNVIKEIGANCKLLNPKAITLEETGKAGHFEIHVKGHFDDESWECLKELAKKDHLGVKQTDHTLVIYAPVSKTIGKLTLS